MTEINITLNDEEFKELFLGNRDEALKKLYEKMLNEFIRVESETILDAKRYERKEGRDDYLNGTRTRHYMTRLGSIVLQIPRHRKHPFHTMLFDNYSRSEASFITTMVEMVVSGVSTRKISQCVETICGMKVSKSTVSEACKNLDKEVQAYGTRSLKEQYYPFVMVDATYFKVRENHKIVSKAFFIALGTTDKGIREVLGFHMYDNESKESWADFFMHLQARGLQMPYLVTSDAHPAILHGLKRVYPNTAWQRCQFHFLKNITEVAPKKYQAGLRTELREMFDAKTIEDARRIEQEILKEYAGIAERAMHILENGFEDAMTVMSLPSALRRSLRTSNALERLNEELKRRSHVIRIFPNAPSLLRLMGTVTMDYSDKLSLRQLSYVSAKHPITEEIQKQLQQISLRQETILLAA